MKWQLPSILLIGIGLGSPSFGQQCPIGCQPQITTLTNDVLYLQTITPRITTSILTVVRPVAGAPPVPGTLDLKPFWKNILLIQVAVEENAMSIPFSGDMHTSTVQTPDQAVLSVPCASGPGNVPPSSQGSLRVSVEAGTRRLTAAPTGCNMTVEVTLLLKR